MSMWKCAAENVVHGPASSAITWELVENANSWPYLTPTEPQSLVVGHLQVTILHTKIREALMSKIPFKIPDRRSLNL